MPNVSLPSKPVVAPTTADQVAGIQAGEVKLFDVSALLSLATPHGVASDGKTNQNADINMPTLYAVPVSGMYRVSAFMVQTVASETSSTLPSLNVQYTEPTTGLGMSGQLMTSSSLNLIGAHQGGSVVILAQQGSSIGYVTGDYASSGATAMRYAVQLKIEFIG